MKQTYSVPQADVKELGLNGIICASGTNGSNEDFGKGNGFSFDLFETLKPF